MLNLSVITFSVYFKIYNKPKKWHDKLFRYGAVFYKSLDLFSKFFGTLKPICYINIKGEIPSQHKLVKLKYTLPGHQQYRTRRTTRRSTYRHTEGPIKIKKLHKHCLFDIQKHPRRISLIGLIIDIKYYRVVKWNLSTVATSLKMLILPHPYHA